MQEKRLILAVALCLVLVFAYTYFLGPKPQPAAPPASTGSVPAQVASTSSAPGATGTPSSGAASSPAAASAPAAFVRAPQQTPEVNLPGIADIKLDSYTGGMMQDALLEPHYTETLDGQTVPVDLARNPDPTMYPLRTAFETPGLRYDPSMDWGVSRNGDYEIDLTQDHPDRSDIAVTKKFTFEPGAYEFDMEVDVKNVSPNVIAPSLVVYDAGWQNPSAQSTSFLTRRSARVTTAMCNVGGSIEQRSEDDLKKKGPFEGQGDVRFGAVDFRYFLLAMLPHDGPVPSSCRQRDLGNGVVEADLVYPAQTIAAGQTVAYHVAVFGGPKRLDILNRVKVGGVGSAAWSPWACSELGRSVDYGWFAFIARPLVFLLRKFQKVVVNWGLAIILLTLFVKAITFYWTNKSMLAMREMSRLKPKLDALKEKFGDDKQRLNQEIMNLYKANGVNPAAGCLPMLLQMPVWFALYRAIDSSVELYNAPFFGWIHNLAGPDPYYIIPVAMGILMVAQQRLTPTTVDSDQQKIMMYMMPIVFTGLSLMLPSGLSLYIIVNSILTMLHQLWLNRRHPMPDMRKVRA
jgi:YidC/Oxa1 family membrane protein insertase